MDLCFWHFDGFYKDADIGIGQFWAFLETDACKRVFVACKGISFGLRWKFLCTELLVRKPHRYAALRACKRQGSRAEKGEEASW